MDRKAAYERIELLRDCIAYSIEKGRLLSPAQRICLNQERAAWLVQLNEDSLNPGHQREPSYKVPVILESKINQITTLIANSNWDRAVYESQFNTR